MPCEKDGSAAGPGTATGFGAPPLDTYSVPPVTNAKTLQSPETARAVVSCAAPGSDRRFGAPPLSLVTKASTLPFVSPGTRFVAAERNATHDAGWWNEPSTAGENDGPSAGRPLKVREIRTVRPGRQTAPSLRLGA